MRRIQQPGPATDPRAIIVPARAVRIDATLAPGGLLLDRLTALLGAHGCDSGCFRLAGGAFGPFTYVMPALSSDDQHAAYYSQTFRPDGVSRLDTGAVTVGLRDDAPFFHCHALWTEPDGRLHGGHALPPDTLIAEPMQVSGVGLKGACFEARPDAETGFPLFSPTPSGAVATSDGGAGSEAGPDALAVRLKPNQDITRALEDIVRDAGWTAATVHGGVASIIGARYADAPPVEPFATEMFLTSGHIDAAGRNSRLRAALVDYTGAISAGVLVVGDNPVLMTVETVLTRKPTEPV